MLCLDIVALIFSIMKQDQHKAKGGRSPGVVWYLGSNYDRSNIQRNIDGQLRKCEQYRFVSTHAFRLVSRYASDGYGTHSYLYSSTSILLFPSSLWSFALCLHGLLPFGILHAMMSQRSSELLSTLYGLHGSSTSQI
jgi:hypothetical protein